MTPNLIIAAILSGTSDREKLFRRVYSDNHAVILNLINRRVNNFHDSEEICHNLFITMYNKMDEINDHGNWLKVAVRYEVMAHIRKNSKSGADISIDEVHEEHIPVANSAYNDLTIILNEAIDRNENFESGRDKVLFQLIGINRYTYSEAAEELGMTRRQAEYAYNKIAQRILSYMKNKGISSEDFL